MNASICKDEDDALRVLRPGFAAADGHFHRGNSTDTRGEHSWNKFQEYAGTEMGMGIPIRSRSDPVECDPANPVVQMAKVGVRIPAAET